jgi:hypothetical protein
MSAQRLPALLMTLSAFGFLGWAIVMVLSPAGSIVLEWIILGVSAAVLGFGVSSLRTDDPKRASTIRMFITAFAVFGAVAVIGLTADDSSSRTWVRLGWAALVVGLLASVAVWWNAPRVDRRTVIAGGVVGLVLLAGGFGITTNCDKSLQRSWCDPAYEQEEVLASRIEVSGDLQRSGRAGGDTGAFVRAYLIEGTAIEASTRVPEGFAYEQRPLQSREVERGRYRAASGSYSNCQIDVKVETVPAGNLETLGVTCRSGD